MTQTEKPQVFKDIEHAQLRKQVESYHGRGWRFVNISGTTVEEGVELLYSFSDGLPLENLRFTINTETALPSVSDLYPNCFFFENETHDLFGVQFTGISIDFDGEFYKVAVPTPMNPHSAAAKASASGKPAADKRAADASVVDTPVADEPAEGEESSDKKSSKKKGA
ncbi:MAG: NADH-quinone oxidoreductase subunit C [Coriobacteriales bacterium]|jgi:hypothetical protein|nr:NADH-quinone oxidoreductase subunit C [Coriobacteriales bacterium]